MDADSAKCMKSMNISSIGERKLRFHNLPPTVCRKIDSALVNKNWTRN